MAAAAILKITKNRDISATAKPILTKICTVVQNWSVNRSDREKVWITQIQDGGRPPIWETVKSPYLRNRSTDFDEICHSDANWPSTGDGQLKFWIFKKTKMAAAAIFKNR